MSQGWDCWGSQHKKSWHVYSQGNEHSVSGKKTGKSSEKKGAADLLCTCRDLCVVLRGNKGLVLIKGLSSLFFFPHILQEGKQCRGAWDGLELQVLEDIAIIICFSGAWDHHIYARSGHEPLTWVL